MSLANEWLTEYVRTSSFLTRLPYYAAVLARWVAIDDPGVHYMAVSFDGRRYVLHLNTRVLIQAATYIPGILQHEVHHVVLGHLVHPKFRDVADEERMTLAKEMSANEYVESPLPDPIVWKPYARWGLAAGQSTLERYELLMAALRHGARVPPSHTVDDHRPWPSDQPHPGAVEATRQLIDDAVREVNAQRGADEPVVHRRFRLAGREPGDVLEHLVGVHGPPQVAIDWREALQRWSARMRVPMHTYARPNRRFPERVGEIPGRRYTLRSLAKPRVLVVVDTSSSMEVRELSEIARQLRVMAEHAVITIVECDRAIARVYPFDGALATVIGRGGTDLRPAFDPTFLVGQRADGVVYFTDGEGEAPRAPPPIPVLWVLTSDAPFACTWGARARLTRRGQ